MKIFYNIIRHIIIPFYSKYLLLKYKDIWGLKSHLKSQISPSKIQIEVYDNYFRRFGSWIGYNSTIVGRPNFPHGFYGIFISGSATIGRNAVIFQQTTIGSNTLKDSKTFGAPTIGENVFIGAGAKIIGNVNIGDNCRIGANAVVYENLASHSVAVQAPTRIIQKKHLDNRHFSQRGEEWFYLKEGVWNEVSK